MEKLETSKLTSITLAAMKIETAINKKNKAQYLRKKTAKFTFPPDFFTKLSEKETEELMSGLVNQIKDDLLNTVTYNDVDSVGIWIDYNGCIYENAISLKVLSDMKEFGNKDVDSMYEFFKMTLNDVYYSEDSKNKTEL